MTTGVDSVLKDSLCQPWSREKCDANPPTSKRSSTPPRSPILETHVHADHLTAADYLKSKVGGRTGIGAEVVQVQQIFGAFFNAGGEFARDGRQFDMLLSSGQTLALGDLFFHILDSPGHTPACVTYVFEGAAFGGCTVQSGESSNWAYDHNRHCV